MSKHLRLAKAVLGEQLYESLHKAIVKLPTRTVVDITEAHDALEMAPKSVMTFLMQTAKEMEEKEAREVDVPFDENTKMLINKLTADQYSGHFVKDGKIIHEFQNTSIPQLSSHILSVFELYNESPNQQDDPKNNPEEPKERASEDSVQKQLDELKQKIDQLFMLAANNKPQIVVNAAPQKDLEKTDKKTSNKSLKKILKKAGMMPKMPSPPRPGTKVGGSQGITRGGLHGPKTEASDRNTHPVTQRKNPDLKVAKPTTPPSIKPVGKTLTFTKSELNNLCEDCGQSGHCICFRALSKPEIKKSEDGKVTLRFAEDWDVDSISAFYRSIKRIRNEQ